ncbi:FecCD family ABC transporter permease [Taklimakanibacter lacteus]|uniref:FecCD family ABC transporter permease n=1 Tax=Taklimakanibacter lacteus TaxID=2268456 RepID=UPI0034D71CAE
MSAPASIAVDKGGRRYDGELLWLVVFAVLLGAAMLGGICLGRLSIAPSQVFDSITRWAGGASAETLEERIVLLVRAPRVLMGALAGMGLAMAGAALQGLFRNPLVSPDILGITAGAAFGGALAILLGESSMVLIGSAFAFGVLALLLVGFISRVDGRSDTMTVVLAGVVVAAMFTALVSFVQFVADPDSTLPAIVAWLMGSFASITWFRVGIATLPIVIGALGLMLLRFRINLLSLGEDEARSFGIRVERERWILFLLVALISGGVVSVSGIVGWVGLVIPHAARLLVGPDHRILVPASGLLGGAYMVAIDTVARNATAAEIPLGVLTAAIGAPIFAILLRRMYYTESRR